MSSAAPSATAGRATPGIPQGAGADERIDPKRLVAFMAMSFGMFMALLDIQVVSASLSDIQAGLSASSDEMSWVQTSYLIAEVVMIPLSGFLGRVLSTRWLFALSAGGFTITSILCGFATNISEMIVFRALQGFLGGAMIPSVFAASFTIFPRSKRAAVQPVVGLIATLAPTIGPTVGGYLTEIQSWHWLFFINIIPGIGVTIAAISLIDFDEPNLALMKRFDWWGLIYMALFLCSLEYVLEEGARNDWFQDESIVLFTILTGVGAVAFFYRVATGPEPIVDMTAFKNRNFAVGCLFSFTLGIGLYGLTYIYPLFLGQVRGYTSMMIGETMFLSGLCMFLTAPIAGRLSAKADPRVMLAVGFIGFAISCWLMTKMTSDWDFWELALPQVFRGVSLMLCIIPINNIALGTLSPVQMKGGSGLYNLMRNMGGAFGLAGINTLINKRWDLHIARLHESVNDANYQVNAWLNTMTQHFADLGPDAQTAALKRLSVLARGQAYVMSLADIFLMLSAIFVVLLPMVFLFRRPRGAGGGGGH